MYANKEDAKGTALLNLVSAFSYVFRTAINTFHLCIKRFDGTLKSFKGEFLLCFVLYQVLLS